MQNVRLRILGDLQLEGCGTAQLGRRQVRTMLKILALGHGRPVALDRLVDCLWDGKPPTRPAEQISVLASRLRGVLGADRVLHSDAGYMLILDWLDLDALREYLAEADRRLAAEKPAAARTVATAGLSLIRGPLLADEPDAWWAESERSAVDLLISRLNQITEFRRAYEPDGMQPAEFLTYGATQRTLSQFIESGWAQIESLQFTL